MNYQAHPTATIDVGCTIGNLTVIWHYSHIMSGAIVGSHCVIGQNVYIAATVKLGNQVKVQNNVSLYDGVICEDDVFIGPSAVFTNVTTPRSAVNKKSEYLKTIVHQGATIGANATILCGITIGKYAMIGAGAVVTNNVQPYALVIGNPAKQVGWVSEYGCKLTFNNHVATCTTTQQKYTLYNEAVTKV